MSTFIVSPVAQRSGHKRGKKRDEKLHDKWPPHVPSLPHLLKTARNVSKILIENKPYPSHNGRALLHSARFVVCYPVRFCPRKRIVINLEYVKIKLEWTGLVGLLYIASPNKVISGFRALRQAWAPKAGREPSRRYPCRYQGGLTRHCATDAPHVDCRCRVGGQIAQDKNQSLATEILADSGVTSDLAP
ncbi:hypothetical protein PoB_004805800 [Plakobranchus ocellatus]|uniref:Uncharacterized protein n=1 Tax=Plakobranchus ocellatus TaxID=259542 RepID=A0AAV4BRU5_9GAST|nr:hypothetical protein PoB_004805800 [Plakobranchus ocellatus]